MNNHKQLRPIDVGETEFVDIGGKLLGKFNAGIDGDHSARALLKRCLSNQFAPPLRELQELIRRENICRPECREFTVAMSARHVGFLSELRLRLSRILQPSAVSTSSYLIRENEGEN